LLLLTKRILRCQDTNNDDEKSNKNGHRFYYQKERVRNQVFSMPIFISPAGVHGLVDPIHGECATAQACANTGIMFGLSQHSTRTIEEICQILPKETKTTTTTTIPPPGTSKKCSSKRARRFNDNDNDNINNPNRNDNNWY
jgi:FMN-dependent dehydrogenase